MSGQTCAWARSTVSSSIPTRLAHGHRSSSSSTSTEPCHHFPAPLFTRIPQNPARSAPAAPRRPRRFTPATISAVTLILTISPAAKSFIQRSMPVPGRCAFPNGSSRSAMRTAPPSTGRCLFIITADCWFRTFPSNRPVRGLTGANSSFSSGWIRPRLSRRMAMCRS
jgi:hypothetical protein